MSCLAPTLRLSPRTVRRGQAVRIESCGFAPNERLFGWMGRSFPWTEQPLELGSLVTDGEGRFAVAVEVPSAFLPGAAVVLFHPLDSDPLAGVGPFATAELTVS